MGKAARLVGARAGQQEAGDPFHRQVGDGLISSPKPALSELFRVMHAIAELLGGEAAEPRADAHTPVVPRSLPLLDLQIFPGAPDPFSPPSFSLLGALHCLFQGLLCLEPELADKCFLLQLLLCRMLNQESLPQD